jgi:hypothetical protein
MYKEFRDNICCEQGPNKGYNIPIPLNTFAIVDDFD